MSLDQHGNAAANNIVKQKARYSDLLLFDEYRIDGKRVFAPLQSYAPKHSRWEGVKNWFSAKRQDDKFIQTRIQELNKWFASFDDSTKKSFVILDDKKMEDTLQGTSKNWKEQLRMKKF